MGLNIDSALHDIANSTALNSIFNNPIYTAIIIVLIMLLIIFIMFRSEFDENSDYSFWVLLFRSGIYLLLPIITIIFIHYKNIEREFEQKYDNKALSKTIDAAVVGEGENTLDVKKEMISGAFKIKPTLTSTTDLEGNENEESILDNIKIDLKK